MDSFRLLFRCGVAASLLACCACGALPKSAPVAVSIEEAPDALQADYFVVPLVPPVVHVMGSRRESGFPAAFHLAGYRPSIALKPGDVISVTIYEVGNSPTFGSLPSRSNFAQAPDGAIGSSAEANVAKSDKTFRMSPVVGRSFNLIGFEKTAGVNAVADRLGPVRVASNGPLPFTLAQNTPQQGGSGASQPSTPTAPPVSSTGTPTSRTLPPLIVEQDGDVLIPYADRVHVAGLTPTQAAEKIRNALADKAVNPQVLVSFVSNGSNQVTVGGDANRPGPIPLSLRGERLLDVVGAAGGSRWPGDDTVVDIVRGQHGARVRLQTIVENPRENITIRPEDQIFLTHDPRSFTVLGASLKVAQYTFDVPKVTLAEAVGRAGGAIDSIGNPAAIYLFREEPTPLAEEVLQIATSLKPADLDHTVAGVDPRRVKLVYKLDMNTAEGYFMARRVTMLDKDVVLVANAEGTQLLKLFTLVRGVTGALGDLNVVGRSTR